MAQSPPIVVVFAASDPTSGAGLQADLLALAALGCHAATVLTAVTVQDTHGVQRLRAMEPDWVAQQARALLADLPVAAFKIGVLGSAANTAVVAGILAEHAAAPVVFDPVLASGRGDALSSDAALAAMRNALLPQVTLATPNSLEARQLADALTTADLAQCARRLIGWGARNVLVTGTHEPTPEVVNTLYGASGVVREDRWPRLPGRYHGSGCTLASAIAAQLALGLELSAAVQTAQDYAWRTLEAAFRPGSGQWIPDRMYAWRGRAR